MSTERTLHTIEIAITLLSPWLVHGNEPGKFGLDATLMRDHQGKLILPGSLIQGRLRHAWNEMKTNFGLTMPKPEALFDSEGNEFEKRGSVIVDDLAADLSDENLLMNTRVSIDPETGAPRQGMLLMIEQTCPPGTPVTFSGKWRVWATEDEAKELAKNIQAGLQWQSQLGAQRSVGFGQVRQVTMNCSKAKALATHSTSEQATTLRLALKFNTPICVESRSRRGNVFISGDVISGGTIKGAMATLMRQCYGKSVKELEGENPLAKYFDGLRISHAFPSDSDMRPAAIPLSLASKDQEIFDMAPIDGPHLVSKQSPTFFHDWKGDIRDEVCKEQQWGTTSTHLRVRTAINEETRTAAKSQLFAYECRVPTENTRWLADISLADIPAEEQQGVYEALFKLLQHGLGPIGKTDAWAEVSFSADQSTVWPQQTNIGNTVTLQLNTPALLIASGQVANQANPDLKAIYTALFNKLSGNSLTLSHFYASHTMAGGGYLHKKQSQQTNYQPYVLTDTGSVFVFTAKDPSKAKEVLLKWQTSGLPLPQAVVDERTDSWQHNPYLPQNGYGEIAINLQHGFNPPAEEQRTPCFGSNES